MQQRHKSQLPRRKPVEDEDDEVDPMDEIEAPKDDKESPSKVRGNGHKRARYYKNVKKNCVVKVDMPMHCPEIVEADSTNREMKEITLYIQDRKQIWLAITDLNWALRYLYVQHLLKGVPMVSADSAGPGAPTSSA